MGSVPAWAPLGSRMTVPMSSAALDEALQRGDVVRRRQQHLAQHRARDAGRHGNLERRVHAGRHAVGPAVEVTGELHELRPAGRGARQPDGQMRRLRSRHREPHHLGRGDEPRDPVGPLDLQLVAGAVVGALAHLPLDRLDHRGVGVPEEQGPVAHPVVDVLPPVHVPLPGPGRPRHVQGKRDQVAAVVRDPARDDAARPLPLRPGAGQGLPVSFCDRLAHGMLLLGRGSAPGSRSSRGRSRASALRRRGPTMRPAGLSSRRPRRLGAARSAAGASAVRAARYQAV